MFNLHRGGMTTHTTHTEPLADGSDVGPARFAVITASVREERLGAQITDWVVAAVRAIPGIDVDHIDLAHIALPDDRLLTPGGGSKTEVTHRIADADAYVIVTPEYNHSYPAALKRLIDWHYVEWMAKPATVVGYGVHGGHAAIEHLRGVLAELNVVTTRRCPSLRAPWQAVSDDGRYEPGGGEGRALTDALAQLRWWSDALAPARRTGTFPH